MKRALKQTMAAMLALCALSCKAGAPAPAITPTQMPAAIDADASTIRVLLSTGESDEMAFTIRGVYSVAEAPDLYRLPEGNYRILLDGSRLSLDCVDIGKRIISNLKTITIEENANDGGTNLLSLVAKSEKRQYLGSIKFWPDSKRIMAVNHIYLESYLSGVLSAEMGNSFPLEALKAQAVAARSYAYKTLEGSRAERYDITDYANTQAYNGYTTNQKIRQAVNDTSRQVLTYEGSVIKAYFSASNGGQTERAENIWTFSEPYLKIRDDPYDLAKGPSQTVYFPTGTTTDKPQDMPTLPLQPLAIAKVSGTGVWMYLRPDTGSDKALLLKRDQAVWIYEANSAWVKAKSGDTVGFIPTRSVRVYALQALVDTSGQRLLASPSGSALMVVPKGAIVTIQSYSGMCLVEYNGTLGYIASKALRLTGYASVPAILPETGNAFTIVSSTSLKASAKAGSKTLSRLPTGSRVTFESQESGWYKVLYKGKTGYVRQSCVQLVIPSLVLTSGGFGATPAPGNDLSYSQDTMDARLVDLIRHMAADNLAIVNASLPDGQKYLSAAENITIKAIIDMTCYPTSNKPYCLHQEGSTDTAHDASTCPCRDYTGLSMTVMLKVRKENASKQGGYDNLDYTCSFSFYIPDYLKSADLPQWKVFTKSYRIYAVQRGADANGIECFCLVNRRFGHGVGLSQWGAYQRALDDDLTVSAYTSILAFYYPGTELAVLNISQTPPAAVPTPVPKNTPTRAPSTTP